MTFTKCMEQTYIAFEICVYIFFMVNGLNLYSAFHLKALCCKEPRTHSQSHTRVPKDTTTASITISQSR